MTGRSPASIRTGVYQHYKGGFYTVLLLATESTNDRTGRAVVVYLSHTTGEVYTRDLREFVEAPVGFDVPRFRRVER